MRKTILCCIFVFLIFIWSPATAQDCKKVVWALDHFDRELHKVDDTGVILKTIPVGGYRWENFGVTADAQGNVWVAKRNAIEKYDKEGELLFVINSIDGKSFNGILALDVYKKDGSVWLVDNGNNRAIRLSKDGNKIEEASPDSGFLGQYPNQEDPMSIEVDQTSGNVWVGTRTVLYKFNEFGVEEIRIPEVSDPNYYEFNNPRMLAVDESDGSVWVTNWFNTGPRCCYLPPNKEVKKISANGEILLTLNGSSNVGLNGQNTEAIRVDQNYGDVWISQLGTPGLVKLDKNGNPLLTAPYGLVAFDIDMVTGNVFMFGRYDYSGGMDHGVYGLSHDGVELFNTFDTYGPVIYNGALTPYALTVSNECDKYPLSLTLNQIQIDPYGAEKLKIQGEFTLDAESDGIDPVSDGVILRFSIQNGGQFYPDPSQDFIPVILEETGEGWRITESEKYRTGIQDLEITRTSEPDTFTLKYVNTQVGLIIQDYQNIVIDISSGNDAGSLSLTLFENNGKYTL